MGLTDTDTCSQCTMGVTDTYLHALWECSPVQGFWNTVTHKLTDILSCRIPPSPSLCLLGIITTFTIPPKYKNSLLTSLTIAKKIILQNWKSKQSMNIKHWSNSLIHHISTSQMTAYFEDDIPSFMETWTPFINHFNIVFNQSSISTT
ncbi:hypothetical protein NQD34_012500 [Periophthalmus magnuspinnatus]|nr:hypothetical protein NQD34_012500 [Periophthalmus magnuspinnatus]